MLNGIYPIIIFHFKKNPPVLPTTEGVPVVAQTSEGIDLPAIPLYLSEKLTGIYIDSEDKNIDVDTTTNGTQDGGTVTTQRPIGSTVTINMKASRNSIGVSLLAALADFVFPKLTSKEYSISYLHGAVTIFQGLLNTFSITQNANDDLYIITLGLSKPAAEKQTKSIEAPKSTETISLNPAIPVGPARVVGQ